MNLSVWQWLSVGSASLGGLGLLAAAWQIYCSRKDAKKLLTIQEALSTRYIGDFPNYLDTLISEVKRTESSLQILCDIPAFAAYSRPVESCEYLGLLETMIVSGKNVSLLHFAEEPLNKVFDEQFSDVETGWDRWKKLELERTDERFAVFVKRYSEKGKDPREVMYREFREAAFRCASDHLDREFRNAETKALASLSPMYFWIFDNERAIITFPNFGHNSTGLAFYSEDGRLVGALRDLYMRFWNDSS